VTSTTFTNGMTVPMSMVYNGNGCTGDDQSPQLTWANPPSGTKSFAVIMFDSTASFTHWGMYNIAPSTRSLPANAGVVGSMYGTQVINDFFVAAEYDGPCPPSGLVHYYVITVYALNAELTLPSPPGFPPVAETLFEALMGHVIQSTSITGTYSD
jgi:Raf kinase inhibitor-like YbhB/YbcL family protein